MPCERLLPPRIGSNIFVAVAVPESLEAEEPLEEPVVAYGTLSAAGKRSLTVKPFLARGRSSRASNPYCEGQAVHPRRQVLLNTVSD